MATQQLGERETAVSRRNFQMFRGRQGRLLRESITAYLFLAPALLIIFTFGIFPIFYARYDRCNILL